MDAGEEAARGWRGRAQSYAAAVWVMEGVRDGVMVRGALFHGGGPLLPGRLFGAGAGVTRDIAVVTRAAWGRRVRLAVADWFVPGIEAASEPSGSADSGAAWRRRGGDGRTRRGAGRGGSAGAAR